jgi:hypothetical protein
LPQKERAKPMTTPEPNKAVLQFRFPIKQVGNDRIEIELPAIRPVFRTEFIDNLATEFGLNECDEIVDKISNCLIMEQLKRSFRIIK